MTDISLGREKVGWSDDIWKQIDQGVHDTINSIRVAAKVFLPELFPGESYLPAAYVNPATGQIQDGPPLPYIEIASGFPLSQDHVDHESVRHVGVMAAKSAATR